MAQVSELNLGKGNFSSSFVWSLTIVTAAAILLNLSKNLMTRTLDIDLFLGGSWALLSPFTTLKYQENHVKELRVTDKRLKGPTDKSSSEEQVQKMKQKQ